MSERESGQEEVGKRKSERESEKEKEMPEGEEI